MVEDDFIRCAIFHDWQVSQPTERTQREDFPPLYAPRVDTSFFFTQDMMESQVYDHSQTAQSLGTNRRETFFKAS